MKTSGRLSTLGMVLSIAFGTAISPAQQMDQTQLDRHFDWPVAPGLETIRKMSAEATPPVRAETRLAVKAASAALDRSTAVGFGQQSMGTIAINPALLSQPTDADVDLSKPGIGFGIPRQVARLAITIDSTTYELFYLNETADPEYQLRHVTMAILNRPGSYARFSVHDGRGLVYGHLYTPEGTFLISPSADKPEQSVYRLSTSGIRGTTAHSGAPVEKDWLARRHQQIEIVSEIQPTDASSVSIDDRGRGARILGGNLGSVRAATAAEFMTAMKRLAAISLVSGNEVFRVRKVEKIGADTRVTFEQLIGNIPTYATNELSFDASGRILHFSTRLFPADAQSVVPNLSQQQALDGALAAWRAQRGSTAARAELTEPARLYYSDWDDAKRLTLLYEFRFKVPGDGPFIYRALVNAATGETAIQDLTGYADFGHTICSRAPNNADYIPPKPPKPKPPPPPQPPPDSCSDGRLEALYSANPGARPTVCPRGGYTKGDTCPMPHNVDATQVMSDVESRMRSSSQLNRPVTASAPMPRCCVGMGGGTGPQIDVITNSEVVVNGGASAVGRGTIHLPPGDVGVETLVHEWAHLYATTYNDRLGGYSDLFAAAVREGMADTIAGLYGAIASESGKFGDPFIYQDGQYASTLPGARRDGTATRTWADIRVLGESHASGQVFYNFFFRLKQASPNTSYERLLAIALGTLATIGRTDNRPLQVSDFRSAVLNTLNKDTEGALVAAVNRVYEAMYGGTAGIPGDPGQPGPSGSPPAPASLFGAFSNCTIDGNTPVTVYSLGWTPVAEATAYDGYAKRWDDYFYTYQVRIPAPRTSYFVWTNVAGDVRLASCNGAGCSGLSTSNFEVSHLPQCQNF